MRRFTNLVLVIAVALAVSVPAFALTAREIVERSADRMKGDDETSKMTMTIINPGGRKRMRSLTLWGKDAPDGAKSLLRFLEPADIEGTGFLSIEHKGRPDDQWLYLPALGKSRRIASGEKSKSFLGTDFTYEDLGDWEIDDYDHEILREEKLGDEDCWVIESTSKKKDGSYSKLITWIRKDNYVGAKIEFYDKGGELLKVLTTDDIVQIDGIWTIKKLVMENVQKGSKTILELTEVKYNQGLKDDLFTITNLERY